MWGEGFIYVCMCNASWLVAVGRAARTGPETPGLRKAANTGGRLPSSMDRATVGPVSTTDFQRGGLQPCERSLCQAKCIPLGLS